MIHSGNLLIGSRHVTRLLLPSSMSKRYATGSSRSRKKRKNSGYSMVDLDLPDEPPADVEIIRVLDVSLSKTTGRVTGTRKVHQHVNNGAPNPAHEEQAPAIEDVGAPLDPEPSEHPPTEPVPNRKQEKENKENDSVGTTPTCPSKPIDTR